MAVYNVHERPRAIVANCDRDSPLWRAVDSLVGFHSPVVIDRQPVHERDLVVVWQKALDHTAQETSVGRYSQAHLRVIQFGGDPVSKWRRPNGYGFAQPTLSESFGDEVHVPPECPNNLRGLVERTLVPLFDGQESRRTVLEQSWEGSFPNPTTFTPLLTTSDGKPLAAIYSHPDIAQVWWLPVDEQQAETFDFGAWIGAALDAWHRDDPQRFPGPPDWARTTEWMTSEELLLQAAVEEAEAELQRQQIELGEKIAAARSALEEAQAQHDDEERVLLTGQSEELVAAVHSALDRLEFVVEDVDRKRAAEDLGSGGTPRPKLEDLRVSDPATSWRALAEVKGYVGGGRTSDFQKINRFIGLYQAKNNNSLPDATWYVVNQFLGRPPGTRPLLMEHQAEDVEVFAENVNGVLIDTRDLFVLSQRVARGELTKEAARGMLMSAKLRFSLDLEDSGGSDNIPAADSEP
ncbi:hypothetical protein HGK72_15045 [Mycolicibacterium fortuitum]|uniref:hypothetical protein n=1 Tax=Mycolicibacterium fortuitum TaxID=1766 RepID=UPI00148FE03B|nr:hypothetical protein [Mycolicibacterium fortuitum]